MPQPSTPGIQFGEIYDVQHYPMRGTADGRSDWVEARSRIINGKRFDFSRVHWACGGVTVRAWVGDKSTVLHQWESNPQD
ncbi:hypothetical protein ACFY0Z_30135 [Streptomyces kronopolitis]|uniref:hypothetical protein n=1 Tax=Streptomyces kronopolitis TaxID=1612435 RepID=UPI0036C6DBDF